MRKAAPKLKHITSFLEDIDDFEQGEKDKWHLQQHRTPPDIAAGLLHHIAQVHDLENCIVADLGIGTGTFLCGLLFLGASYGVGYEIDSKYIDIAEETINEKLQDPNFDLVLANLSTLRGNSKIYDLVVTNPPFGTKEAGIDVKFLEYAVSISNGPVYSFHKTSTRDFIKKTAQRLNRKLAVLNTVQFPLPKRFGSYHKKDIAFTEVDIVCLTPFTTL